MKESERIPEIKEPLNNSPVSEKNPTCYQEIRPEALMHCLSGAAKTAKKLGEASHFSAQTPNFFMQSIFSSHLPAGHSLFRSPGESPAGGREFC